MLIYSFCKVNFKICLFFFILVVQGLELRASHLLRRSTICATLAALRFVFLIYSIYPAIYCSPSSKLLNLLCVNLQLYCFVILFHVLHMSR
jgi:hypothetical protein